MGSDRPDYLHPRHRELYTPYTPELIALFERMRDEWDSWRRVAAVTKTRMKVLRNIRTGKRKVISMSLLDRMITTTGVGSLEEFIWFTADDLVALGIWNEIFYVEGVMRRQGEHVHLGVHYSETRAARKASKNKERWRRKMGW